MKTYIVLFLVLVPALFACDVPFGKAVETPDGCVIEYCLAGHQPVPTNDQCERCPVGTFSDADDTAVCKPCTNKPLNARYTLTAQQDSHCKYECPPGTHGKTCRTTYGLLWPAVAMLSGFGFVAYVANEVRKRTEERKHR